MRFTGRPVLVDLGYPSAGHPPGHHSNHSHFHAGRQAGTHQATQPRQKNTNARPTQPRPFEFWMTEFLILGCHAVHAHTKATTPDKALHLYKEKEYGVLQD
eukprot:2507372-Amphidinium_carterae.1